MTRSPTFDRALAWWRGLSHRERNLLRVLGAILAVFLVITLIVRPLQNARAAALADIRTYETLAERLKLAGPGLRPQTPRRSGAPADVAAQSAASVGLTLGGTQAAGGGLQVNLAAAPFDAVLRWLADLETSSDLRAIAINLQAGASPGRVQGNVVLVQ